MTIYKGSRYEYSKIDFVQTAANADANPIVFYQISSIPTLSYFEHVYVEGERLDEIAYKYYKSSSYWWIIPEFNTQLTDFTNIPSGTVLKIPNV